MLWNLFNLLWLIWKGKKAMKEYNLLPCAHCGSSDVHISRIIRKGIVSWAVMCCCCGMRTVDYDEYYDDDIADYNVVVEHMEIAVDGAVFAWNRRRDNGKV